MGGFVFVTAEANNGGRTTHVTSIASSGNYVYAGTDGGGVYKSSDAGATWTNISRSSNSGGQNVVDPYVNDIFIDPDDNNTIYAATGYLGQGHLYRSLDGGDTWNSNYSEEWDGILSVDNAVLTVVCDGGGSDYVWAGTEGLGAIYSTNGEDFQWGGSVTNPVPGGANIGDGAMSLPVLSPSTITENWTATYVQPLATATLPQAGFLNTGSGTMSGITTDVTATLTEDWTVQYDGTQWAVQGSVSGVMTNKATTGVPYISDSGEISFTISAGTVAFVALDYFTFSTTASDPYWNVAGSVSGIQFNKAETNLWYNSDDYEVSFIITEGLISFSAGDTFTFSVAESGLGYGRTVKDIVKKPGTNGNTAVLYAATGRGVYRSINGGQTWSETSSLLVIT